ncbi:MAG: hypothetical protein HYW27_04675 [Candidatus Aenigmarchaeota archaeon]|nr:hypothetical protein [Candidatus Aenigmarchaeota archaeon]
MPEDCTKSLGMEERPEWAELATFVPNKRAPVYNWFYYKEGFSRDLVMKILDMFQHNAEMPVLDPFCGSGTTLLACRELGIDSIGFDVLPVSVFASDVKTRNYDAGEIRRIYAGFRKKFEKLDREYPPLMKRAFSKYALQDISLLMRDIMKIEDEKYRNFFLLALINASMKCSYARKDGGAIKTRIWKAPPLRIMFRHVLKRMAKDTEKIEFKACMTSAEAGDARRLGLEDESVGSVITSPPYLNNIDYTKVYAIEEFFIQSKGLPPLRSYIGSRMSEESFMDLPPAAVSYFLDMKKVIGEMHRVCMKGANVGIVIGNGFTGEVIDSDIILAKIAEDMGFSVEKIIVLNKRFALVERTKKSGVLRESLLLLRK